MYGIFNQKGFVLPLTMTLCLLFPLVILSEIELYKIEQRFQLEEEEMERLHSLTQMGIYDLNRLLSEQTFTETTVGMLYYPTGSVQYSIEPQGSNFVLLKGNCLTTKQRKHFFIATVNIGTNEVENWVEG